MELGSLIGFIAGFVFMLLGMLMSCEWSFARVAAGFIDWPSVMVTIGGSLASLLISTPIPKVINAVKAISKIFKVPNLDPAKGISQIINLANLARKEGILALEEAASTMEDPFLKKGVMLIVDGTDPELVRNILETELSYLESRHGEVRGVWDAWGALGPAWGMIGTLIGLVLMLQEMNDPSSLGPKMAVALVTTFYGSVIANYVCMPVSMKMKDFSGEEILLKEVLIEGILSIQAGENPRIIEEKLKAFLAPALRGGGEDSKKESEE